MQRTYYVEERILRFVYRYKVQSESFVTDHEIMAFFRAGNLLRDRMLSLTDVFCLFDLAVSNVCSENDFILLIFLHQ